MFKVVNFLVKNNNIAAATTLVKKKIYLKNYSWYQLKVELWHKKKSRFWYVFSNKEPLFYFIQITQQSNKNFYCQILDLNFKVLLLLKKKEILNTDLNSELKLLSAQLIKYIFQCELTFIFKIYNIAYKFFFVDYIWSYINTFFLFNYTTQINFIIYKPNNFIIKINKRKIKSIKKSKKKLLYKTYKFLKQLHSL